MLMILKSNDMHPYPLQEVQLLEMHDLQLRLTCSLRYLQKKVKNPLLPASVLIADKAYFRRDRVFSVLKTNVGGRYVLKLHRYVDITGYRLIAAYLLSNCLKGTDYFIYFQQVLPKLLDNELVSTEMHPSLWYQLDGSSTHFLYATI
ncbi:hypothetical protein TNIN_330211 [Trichonephila inaurata madagascariensis]|uniref:Transposase n=1 Tax=Trichonephila inaurata madagascariensis TaxID=2747483 RepID=A0A8X7CSK5_9ARAC|nr:hypothetical protein TNIN_330211 [Trichonephila inaurata madagascariensis]